MLLSHHIWLKNNPGKRIPKSCVVHHKDLNPYNNKYSNLQLMKDKEHKRLHMRILKEVLNKK